MVGKDRHDERHHYAHRPRSRTRGRRGQRRGPAVGRGLRLCAAILRMACRQRRSGSRRSRVRGSRAQALPSPPCPRLERPHRGKSSTTPPGARSMPGRSCSSRRPATTSAPRKSSRPSARVNIGPGGCSPQGYRLRCSPPLAALSAEEVLGQRSQQRKRARTIVLCNKALQALDDHNRLARVLGAREVGK